MAYPLPRLYTMPYSSYIKDRGANIMKAAASGTLHHIGGLYAPAKAETLAAKLNAEGDDWKYEVVHNPKGTGYSFIRIYDEDGIYIGNL